MAAINWNQMAAPDFKAANALLLSGQEQFNTAIDQAGKVVTDYQAANTKNNTQAIMNALQSAKSPEEYQAALANAQAIAATKSGDFDQDKFNAATLTQPGVLDAQQQQDWAWKDRDPLAEAQRIIMSGGKPEDIAALNFQSDAARVAAANMYQQGTANMFAANKDTREESTAKSENEARVNKAATDALNAETESFKSGAAAAAKNAGTRTVTNYATGETTSVTGNDPYGLAEGGNVRSTVDITKGVALQEVDSLIERQFGHTRKAENRRGDPNAKNPNSTASGYDQITDSTFLGLTKQNFASRVAGLSDKQILSLKSDDKFSGAVAKSYHLQNAGTLTNGGVPVNQLTLDASYMWDGKNAVKAYNALQQNPNAPLSTVLSPKAIKDNMQVWKNAGAKDPSNPTVADGWNGIAKRQGVLDSSGNTAKPANQDKELFTGMRMIPNDLGRERTDLSTKTGKALRGIDVASSLSSKGLDAPERIQDQAKLEEYLTKNKGGFLARASGQNSTAGEQLRIAREVGGFDTLPAQSQLAVLKKLDAFNEGKTLKYWTNLGDDELKTVVAQTIEKAINEEDPSRAIKQKQVIDDMVGEFRGVLEGRNIDQASISNEAIIAHIMGADAAKDYQSRYAKKGVKNITDAASKSVSTTQTKPPVIPTNPVVARTREETPLGILAMQGIASGLGSVMRATPVADTALRLLSGGNSEPNQGVLKDVAGRLKYGALYPDMKRNNDPRLKN